MKNPKHLFRNALLIKLSHQERYQICYLEIKTELFRSCLCYFLHSYFTHSFVNNVRGSIEDVERNKIQTKQFRNVIT